MLSTIEPSDENAYRTLARWVKAFRTGWNETVDLHRAFRPSIPQNQIEIVSDRLSIDRRWTFWELSVEIGLKSSSGVADNEEMS